MSQQTSTTLPINERINLYDYKCSCKGFHRMGWICSHVLVIMNHDETISLNRSVYLYNVFFIITNQL